jgi:predicted TIM-barrel fold metal-dependent hydrolase
MSLGWKTISDVRMKRARSIALLVTLSFAASAQLHAQLQIDPRIAAEISKIKAIDNHAHPVRPVWSGPPDTQYDALPVDSMEPYTEPLRTRAGSPLDADAWHQLFGAGPMDQLKKRRQQLIEQKRDGYANWVLDQLGIETMLANRVALGPGLAPPRFLWVPFEDALMFPLDNHGLASKNSDVKAFFADEDRLRQQYLKESGYSALPASFAEYLEKVVDATLQRHKRGGAVAVKFEAAYLRPLDFDDVPLQTAEAVYNRGRNGSISDADYKKLQDHIFRHIAAEAGRLGMAVHLHVAWGAGGYFQIAGTNPLQLESSFNDPRLHHTNFVMLHGGWPFTREITALLTKPNVYADFSAQTLMLYPRGAARILREWLEFAPDKVLFGTDAYPYSEESGWEQSGWIATQTTRQALGLALTEMMNDGEITRQRAFEMAHMVLHDNAAKLYGLKK